MSVQAAALQGDDSTPSAFYSFGVKAKNVSWTQQNMTHLYWTILAYYTVNRNINR